MNVKGLVFRNGLRELEALEGAEVAEQVVGSLRPELRDGIRYGGIGPGAWVPVAWQRELVHAIARSARRGPSAVREIGRRTLLKDLSGVYRIFTRALGPERLLSVSTRFFNQYYDQGQATILESRAGYALVEWGGCPEFDALMWSMIIGSSEGILVACRAEQVRLHTVEGGRDGDGFLRLRGHWL